MDDQQRGEELDESLPTDVPPDEPTAVEDTGVTGFEQLGGESFEERESRTEPEVDEHDAASAFGEGTGTAELLPQEGAEPTEADTDVLIPADEAAAFGEGTQVAEGEYGPLSEEDEFSGDETTRDVATERTSSAAEEAAIHIDDEGGPNA